jgi:hypothetical protein
MRASSQRYPKAHLAAISFAGLILGYAYSRRLKSPGRTQVHRRIDNDLSPGDLNEFFNATRHAWGLAVCKSLASGLISDCFDDIQTVTR